jgi:two-component system, OmpR family, response regulator MtrA
VAVELENERPTEECALHVLVVEDDPSARESIQTALRDRYTLQFVSGASEALGAIRMRRPDVLVSEVDLPEGDGLQLCSQVRELPEAEQLPIMLLTARGSIQDKVAGFQAGADDYIVKPVDARLFYARIRLLYRIKGIEHPRSDKSA